MSNRKLSISATGKDLIDQVSEILEVDRPQAIKIALAKGIAKGLDDCDSQFEDGRPKWTMPESIIKGQEYVFFKHLIIDEQQKNLSDEEINEYFRVYLETGLRVIRDEIQSKTSLEDIKIKIIE